MSVSVRRRDILAGLAAIGTSPLAARAQQRTRLVGVLHSGAAAGFVSEMAAFHQGLKDAGYIAGQNVSLEFRWANSRPEALPQLANDLVQMRPAVIVAMGGNTPALAAKAATTTIPIVFNTGADPVRAGLVASLNRPGGNVTGVSFLVEQLGSKMVGLLRELVPGATKLGYLANPSNPNTPRQVADTEAAARSVGVGLEIVNASQPGDLETAFATLTERGVGGLVLSADPLFGSVSAQVIEKAAAHRIPTIYYRREFAEEGGLMSYGTSATESYSQAGNYAGRILKGADPRELPVFQVLRFELVLNLKTAKALNLEVPAGLSARADHVIE
jgi:putative ABC transport system substrate-binding protein